VPKQKYLAIAIGRDDTNKRWATILEHIEDGVVVKRELLCTNASKSTALDRCKIALIKRLLKEEFRVL